MVPRPWPHRSRRSVELERGRVACGAVRTPRRLLRFAGAPPATCAASVAEACGHQLGERRVRGWSRPTGSVTVGRGDFAATELAAVVPGRDAGARRCRRTRSSRGTDQLERRRGRGSRGRRRTGITTQSSARQLAGLDGRRRRLPADATRPDVDEGDERAARRDDPVVELAAGGEWRPRRTPGAEVERFAWTNSRRRSPQARQPRSAQITAGSADARQARGTRRGCPPCRAIAPIADAGRMADVGRSRSARITGSTRAGRERSRR